MSRTVDFDAFRREQQREPLHLVINGRTRDLPPSLPASLALDVLRIQQREGDATDVSLDDLLKVGGAMFGGDDAFAAVMAEGDVALDELPDLIRMVLEAYQDTDPNPPARERRARTSAPSVTGR